MPGQLRATSKPSVHDENQNRASCADSFHQHIASDGVLAGSGASPPFGTTEACRKKMQSRDLFYARRMNIAKDQHVFESVLAPRYITASSFETLRICYCPEHN